MATITPYKIATRIWSAKTMGESSGTTARSLVITSGLNNDELYKCINQNVLNHSAADKPNYVVPYSIIDGAVPDSYMRNGDKCVTQAYLDGLYAPKYLNFTTNIQHNKNSDGSYLVPISCAYQVTINAEYENIGYSSSNNGIIKPILSNIYTELSVEIRFEYYTGMSINSTPHCYYIKNCTIPVNKDTIGTIKLNLLTAYNGAISQTAPSGSTITNPTGEVSESTFMYYHLEDMFNYFNPDVTNSNPGFYSIKIKVSPEYAFKHGTLYEPQHYIAENIITVSTYTGGTDYNDNILMCNPNYNMTSGPSEYILTPGTEYTWNYNMIVDSFVPSITPQSDISLTPENYITLSNYKGAESMQITAFYSWNLSRTELTIYGSIKAVINSINPPSIKFEYKMAGYQSYVKTIPVNLKYATPAE